MEEVTYKNNKTDVERTKHNLEKNGAVGDKNSNQGKSAYQQIYLCWGKIYDYAKM